ncbi:hypothetical protein Ddc_23150 [Ditylenchus destructor]|nr:hypothetical protein Ddc_23150 [Ditylenchus destructor]
MWAKASVLMSKPSSLRAQRLQLQMQRGLQIGDRPSTQPTCRTRLPWHSGPNTSMRERPRSSSLTATFWTKYF